MQAFNEYFDEPIPLSISNLFTNPMHIITIVFSSLMLVYFLYRLYMLYQKRIHKALKATLPETLTQHMPLAPPAYEHNKHQGIPMISLNLKWDRSHKRLPKEGEKYQLTFSIISDRTLLAHPKRDFSISSN